MASSSPELEPPFNPALDSTWVLLRGWTREARHWRSFPSELSNALAPYEFHGEFNGEFNRDADGAVGSVEVLCLDLPGAGTGIDAKAR